ncbi:VWA domain-containing protein [Sorangium sp. So ce406]|uniref:VWA domain-containing protein n=1 Tax=Sorangium sp. So ce406 TaxID=3133311 RepID=UPI003F5BD242
MSGGATPGPAPPLAAEELPLFELFQDLREAGLSLGTRDYLELLRALRMGEGLDDTRALLRLCQLLWTGTREESRLLERLFDRTVEAAARRMRPAPEPAAVAPEPAPPPPASAAGSPAAPPPAAAPAVGAAPAAPAATEARPPPRGRALELALAMLRGAPGEVEPTALRRALPDEYLPVSPRQMRQAWRRLRRMERRGPRTEPDVDATLAQIARDGVFLGPALVARRTNVERLLLLVDRHGSMTPFQVLTRRLVETARRGGRLAHVGVWYFDNTPLELDAGLAVHREGAGGELVLLRDVLSAGPRAVTGALVVSDAGAARRAYSTERIEATGRFLGELRAQLRRVAWINPVPRHRWPGTSAQAVRAVIPMFEADRAGLDAALRVLRGRRPHPHGGP